ncbi:PVC-type heme-binding CxxCH protein [Roseimaritima sediminicola]|uniref:PVC-type heme-binding CxxCH protein n=1 Tax=Roseimaritima sediminicola TaxID=2662066 RepID=UPI0012982EA9|nr:PVC-type heme-binding CxxCH protein [Roseimaritima sediminicola]
MKRIASCLWLGFACLLPSLLLPSPLLADTPPGAQEPGQQTGTDQPGNVRLQNADRVVLLGDGLIEQEQYFGWVETALTAASDKSDLTFRNLGWNADTPSGASRLGLSLLQAGREPEGESLRLLREQLELTQPTLLIIGYGMASSLEGGLEGLENFRQDYQQLLDMAREVSPEVRFVLLAPLERSDQNESHARVLREYSGAIAELADANDAGFVDLSDVATDPRLRKDPIHLNGDGYRELAKKLCEAFGLENDAWQTSPRTAALRSAILRKNVWWFHRSRPANMAYVFGFRKREQGQNAVEIPQYDGLIAADEARIAKLRSLEDEPVAAPPATVESKYAEFTPQATPEFTVADGWEVSLWAENPQLNKPIHMNFDPEGRLWIASSEAYPMIEVGQAAPDKVIVLEDTDGDGRADQSTVFADNLLIPTGIAPGDGGVYVAQSTDLLFLKDTDGDGKADSRQRVLSGFGTEDTHHNLHSLQWGPDGRLYMNQSVYTRTDTETPRGVVRLRAGGGFRYDTRSMRMQIFFRGLWNPWGHQFDAHGQSFLSDGAGFDGLAWAFPGAVFFPTPQSRRTLDLISPGRYPKFASLEVLSGPSFPQSWQGSIVTCDFRANRVTRFSVDSQDAGFVTTQEDDLLRTATSTFRPIDVKQGPDGALYIADWSNPIINHGEVDFRDPRRDRWHGRIWRMVWKGGDPQPIVNLREQSTAALLENLGSQDRYLRDKSRRVLIERGDVLQPLAAWTSAQTDPSARLQALWLYQALRRVNTDLLDSVLAAESAPVRAAAVRVLADWADPAGDADRVIARDAADERLRQAIGDEHPRVRLEAIRALDVYGDVPAIQMALQALDQPTDRFLQFALAQLVDDASEPVMHAIQSGQWTLTDPQHAQKLEFVLASVAPRQAQQFLQDYLAQNQLDRTSAASWIRLIGQTGGPDQLRQLWQQASSDGFDKPSTLMALDALIDAQRLRKQRPSGSLAEIARLIQSPAPEVRRRALQLVATWKLGGQAAALANLALDTETDTAMRRTAIGSLGAIGKPPAAKVLREVVAEVEDAELRVEALVALTAVDAQATAEVLPTTLAGEWTAAQARRLWEGISRIQKADAVIAGAIGGGDISETVAKAGVEVLRRGGREDSPLLAALQPHAGQAMQAQQWTPERIAGLVARVEPQGDPHRGEFIYRREKLQCVSCHAIGGVGGQVGPDLTSLGASAPVDYIAESLFIPDAKIKEGFHSVVVATEDGQVVTGILVESDDEQLVLRNASNELVQIPQIDVVLQKNGPSLMPVGAVDSLSDGEQVDLIAFLSRLGKPGPFDASRSGVARRFEMLAGTHRIEQEGLDRIVSGQRTAGWEPLPTRVNGDVTKRMLEERTQQYGLGTLVNLYLRTRLRTTNAQPLRLVVDNDKPVTLWVDGRRYRPQEDGNEFVINSLAPGEHTVLLRIDARDLPEAFSLGTSAGTFAVE